jgi:hypothetical protein
LRSSSAAIRSLLRLRAARTIHRISFRSRSTRGHYVCLPHDVKSWSKTRALRWVYIAISRTARCVDSAQLEAFKLAGFHGGALVMSKQVNGFFSHVATTEAAYDKDIGHSLSRTGLVHANAGLFDSMCNARGERRSRQPSRQFQYTTWRRCSRRQQRRFLVAIPSLCLRALVHQFDGAFLDIRPRVSFRRLYGVRPACRRRFRSAFDSHGACVDFVPRGALLARRRVPLFA